MSKGTSGSARPRHFRTPGIRLAIYAAYMALLFSLGQHYPLVPWLLIVAVAVGIPAFFIIGHGLRASPWSRPWSSAAADDETDRERPGLGLLLIVALSGPAPFLLSAVVQHWLLGSGVGTVWMLACSAAAVFGLIFGGYYLIEATLNRRAGSVAPLRSSARS